MQIAGSVALVTGASRGLGRHFAAQLLQHGVAKVYATARRPDSVDVPGAEVLSLDITDPASIAAAAKAAGDVTLLVNNAGVATFTNLTTSDMDMIRLEMDTHYYGLLNMIRAFAPILRAGGGGAIVNVLSAGAWAPSEHTSSYCAAKAAAWSLTNSVRLELASQNTQVTGLILGPTDTDMGAGVEMDKNDPADVVRATLDGIEAGHAEVIADALSAQAKANLALDPAQVYQPTSGPGEAVNRLRGHRDRATGRRPTISRAP
ncbi:MULTISPECIES: SDR family oxidoreductase [unclassified Parafrankia]|uniref:SDR family oxidoreductase n=1 Tax=unclassified Parafrankia TaxID=2994368 RepID=UPI000DA48352|nr:MULTISPECIES: SDR family oxidoreductase [unclassified Parafrankia]TCJ32100.1 SDR family NAD(P)-dependent oxidoreductase [Parafrankia sp. BMG5.11]SQD97396.1 Short-chain dehydrogenase/reductase SDR [Parafrankia sp. Ea1.12]